MKIVYHHRTRATDAQRIHILELVRAFEALGHQVEIASLIPIDAEQSNPEREAGEALWQRLVRKLPFAYELVQLGYNLIGLPILLSAVWRVRPEFIYERYSLFNFTGVLVAWLFRKPIVLEVNSPLALEQSRDKQIRLLSFARWTEKTICRAATKVIVVSSPLARILAVDGVPAEKIEVMANGVSTEHFNPDQRSTELRDTLGLNGSIVIGFVGWFRKWHGLEMLLEAFHEAKLASKQIKLLLIGDGPAMPELQAFVKTNRMQHSVVFTGPLAHVDVPKYLAQIDIAVQPAANEYCCPMKILEYMALGKAIVAPRQENIQELLTEGKEAEYFVPNDTASLAGALLSLVGAPHRIASMGQATKAGVEERGYYWTSNAERVIQMVTPGYVASIKPAYTDSSR